MLERSDQQAKKLSTHAALKAAALRQTWRDVARARLSAESESEVVTHAMGERANRSVEGM